MGVDVSSRAVNFARLNAMLNGTSSVFFTNPSGTHGVGTAEWSWNARFTDLDMTGNALCGPFQVYVNNEAQNHSITFRLRNERGNCEHGIGCRITVHYGPDGRLHQTRESKASGGFHSFDAPEAHFGLGEETQIGRVEVRWSTGETTVFEQPFPAGGDYVLTREKRQG